MRLMAEWLLYNRALHHPSIIGYQWNVGEVTLAKGKTVLQPKAYAKISARLVPGQDGQDVHLS